MTTNADRETRAPDAESIQFRLTFSRRVKYFRQNRNLSRASLAEKVGVSEISIGQYERGERLPSLEVAHKISLALNVTLDMLIGEDGLNRQFEFSFLQTLGFRIEENSDGSISLFSKKEMQLFSLRAKESVTVNRREKLFLINPEPDLIARFTDYLSFSECVWHLEKILLNALGARYYAHRFFAEVMAKHEVEIPELILLEKSMIGELPPAEVKK